MPGQPRNRAKRALQDQTEARGGASNPRNEAGGGTCMADATASKNHEPSPSIFLSPAATIAAAATNRLGLSSGCRPEGGLLGRPEVAVRVVPVEAVVDCGGEELLGMESAEDGAAWLERNTPRLLEVAARRAASFRDPMFSSMFFKGLLDHQTAKVKTTIGAKGGVLEAMITANPGQKALIEAASHVDGMDAEEAMRAFRTLGGGC
jgi:hypothetical protein